MRSEIGHGKLLKFSLRMLRPLIFLFTLCGIISFTAILPRAHGQSGNTTSPANPTDQSEVKATYESVCATCHGLDAHGSERGPNIATRPEIVDKSDAALLEILKNGKTSAGMPAFAAFGEPKLAALVAYLRTLQGHGDDAPVPGDPANGKTLFFGKAKCATCHMISGQGGFLAQDLTTYASRRNADDVRARILNPDKDLDARRGVVTVVLADSSKLSGTVRSEDNFSLQLQTSDGVFHLLNKAEIRSQTYVGKSGMPSNYGSTLSQAEMNDLVSYLLRASKSKNKKNVENAIEDGDED